MATPIKQLAKTAALTVQKVRRKVEREVQPEPLPKFKRVSSTHLRRVMYDRNSRTLTIEFNSRRTYLYSGVPQRTYEGLMGASSKGTYFSQNIRFKFPYQEV